MKKNTEIEELIASAQRQQADLKRQQKLSDLIDQWAAEESASTVPRRKNVWPWISIAASILVVFGIGLSIVNSSIGPNQDKTQTAKAEPIVTVPDSTSSIPMEPSTTSKPSPVIAKTRVQPSTVENDCGQTDPLTETQEPATEISTQAPEPYLIAENNEFPTTIAETTISENTTTPTVMERTSNRLVRNASVKTEKNTNPQNNREETIQPIRIDASGTESLFALYSWNL